MSQLLRYLKNIFNPPNSTRSNATEPLTYDLKNTKVIVGKLLSELNKQKKEITSLKDVEFQVFSQWGDDGIIQYLINKINIPNETFIEFGVENYKESNTRFLLINNNWSGLVIDGSKEHVDFIDNDPVSWAHELFAVHSFITTQNINKVLGDFLSKGYDKEIGILSIDIDGNDYWIWEEISVVNPVIVIAEYNSIFGADKPWTIEYSANFVRGHNKSPSHIFYGASLLSLCDLGDLKGYSFIGCNSSGNNAYFVRKDKMGGLKPLQAKEGYVASKFRELVDAEGQRVNGKNRLRAMAGLKVFNTRTKQTEIITDDHK